MRYLSVPSQHAVIRCVRGVLRVCLCAEHQTCRTAAMERINERDIAENSVKNPVYALRTTSAVAYNLATGGNGSRVGVNTWE